MATSGESDIARIYVTGGTANLAALGAAIQRRSRVPVEAWAPTEKVFIEAKEVDSLMLTTRAAQLAVALGLALRKEKEARA
jgi:type IV pilus assembly protein PilM